MKTLQLTFCAFLAIAGFAVAGISASPWSFAGKAAGWTVEDKNEEIAEGVQIEFMVSGKGKSSRLVAISSPVRKGKNALNEFAGGIRDSFAKRGVLDLKESKATKWQFEGLSMVFSIPSDAEKINCDAFFFEQDRKFWAVMAFGPEQKDLPKVFGTLNKKEIERGAAPSP